MNFTKDRHDTYAYIEPSRVDLTGKYVLITGAAGGIGRATATSYARAGASRIAIADLSSLDDVVQEIKEAAANSKHPEPIVIPVKLDVTDRASVQAAVKPILEAFDGRLDVLINNAGYLSRSVGIPDTDPDDWWRDFEVNVKGVYLMTHTFWPLLLKSSTKIILNLGSIAAVSNTPLCSSYGSAKLAVLRFTEYIVQDHGEGKDGILAIAVHPGGIKTKLGANLPEELHDYLIDTPQLAGDTLMWLGAERREWLAGRYVSSCWDMEELEGRREEIVKGDLLKVKLALNSS